MALDAERQEQLIEQFELKRRAQSLRKQGAPLTMAGQRATWHRPGTLQGLLDLKKEHSQKTKLVCGTPRWA